jgi:inosose dehydratase
MSVSVANAPLSYGAFEITVGSEFPVPDPVQVLAAIGSAGYAGTDLGPPGYLGEGQVLHERLHENGLALVGGFVPIGFSVAEEWEPGVAGLRRTLDLFDAAEATGARPVLCDAGGPERLANPGRGGEDPSLRLDDRRWRLLLDNVERAAELSRERGYEPMFHHHTATYVEGLPEIERFLEGTDVALLLDSAHLTLAGGDPITAWRDWRDRIETIHLKDIRMSILEGVRADRVGMLEAWQRGVFCALGEGDVDLDGFCKELADGSYDGWVVIEQDRVLANADELTAAIREQAANREWIRSHAGW